MESTLAKAAESMQGILDGLDGSFRGVSTDTRALTPGQLFVALHGPNFDGTKFVKAAADCNAAAAVVDHRVAADLPSIRVADTGAALGQLALAWRQQVSATIVGITGSNGKTTLKELTASCLSQSAKTLATKGNLNNHIGLPLTLLDLSLDDRFGVIEMGANHAGEIAYLASLARPSVVAITNAGPAHLEGFGSIEGVAHAKGELLQVEPRPKCAVLNADDDYFDLWRGFAADIDVISFGSTASADVYANDVVADDAGSTFRLHTPTGSADVYLPLPGEHNVMNACAAAAIACALQLPLPATVAGLESVAPVSGRLLPLAGFAGAHVYDDSYNANPASVRAAAEFLAAQDGDSILVLADMGELGPDTEALHFAVGQAARDAGVDRLLATGDLSRNTVEGFGPAASWYADVEELTRDLQRLVTGQTSVLVKGSRATRMGRVVRAIQVDSDEAKAC